MPFFLFEGCCPSCKGCQKQHIVSKKAFPFHIHVANRLKKVNQRTQSRRCGFADKTGVVVGIDSIVIFGKLLACAPEAEFIPHKENRLVYHKYHIHKHTADYKHNHTGSEKVCNVFFEVSRFFCRKSKQHCRQNIRKPYCGGQQIYQTEQTDKRCYGAHRNKRCYRRIEIAQLVKAESQQQYCN